MSNLSALVFSIIELLQLMVIKLIEFANHSNENRKRIIDLEEKVKELEEIYK